MPAELQPPSINDTAFSCPHCEAYSRQTWGLARFSPYFNNGLPELENEAEVGAEPSVIFEDSSSMFTYAVHNLHIAVCSHCAGVSLWRRFQMIWPVVSNVPDPNEDLPQAIKDDYLEAALILENSPRGAAALLRLAVQKLCVELGGSGKNIDADIGALVVSGLDSRVQKALDVVRVVGNNAVHPGTIDLRDDKETAGRLFGLINLIAEIMITQKKQLDAMFSSLPSGALAAIERRDKGK